MSNTLWRQCNTEYLLKCKKHYEDLLEKHPHADDVRKKLSEINEELKKRGTE